MNHSRESYDRLARELGGYRHPWTRVLSGPDPELTFDLWLSRLLTPQTRVLEAGCGHGPDAARFGPEDRVSVLALATRERPASTVVPGPDNPGIRGFSQSIG